MSSRSRDKRATRQVVHTLRRPSVVQRFFPPTVLIALTVLAYWPVLSAGFVNFDDPGYVINNPHVEGGLSWAGWRWAWTSLDMWNWHPLTWLSWQCDAQFFGPRPKSYHATNVALHVINVLLLYGWLSRLLRSTGVALFAAALFAVHPLHVESVAWISERKDVLSSSFGLASLWAYTNYTSTRRKSRFALALALFAMSLLAKPMWVTLPPLLLLLDVWPLQRMPWSGIAPGDGIGWRRILGEKIPFLTLTIISCAVTVHAQQSALRTWEAVPLATRLGTAVAAYAIYLQKTLYPVGLSALYPYPTPGFGWPVILGASTLLVAISLASLATLRRQPGWLIGWLWFLGTLVPVIGIVQVGDQAYADRYTYLPHIGLFLGWSYELARLVTWRPALDRIVPLCGGLVVLTCAVTTTLQAEYWQNSESLWRHALSVTENNATAHNQLGAALAEQNRHAEAQEQFEEAARIQPGVALSHFNLGVGANLSGQFEQAERHFRDALRLEPDYVLARQELGTLLAMTGRIDEALPHLKQAAEKQPQNPAAWQNLARAQRLANDLSGSIAALRHAAELQPDDVSLRILLATTEFDAGRVDDARRDYQRSLELDSNWPASRNAEAWNLATYPDSYVRNGNLAVEMARAVCQATANAQPEYLETLAAAYAEAGRFDDAVATAQQAVDRFVALGQVSASATATERLKSYQARRPWRQSPSTVNPGSLVPQSLASP